MKSILKDRIFKSFLNLFSGDMVISVLSIISITFITRTLGVEKYGLLVLIQGICAMVDGLFNFQSWQGFIKFFPQRRDSKEELKKLIKFSYFQDIVTGIITLIIINLLGNLIGSFYEFSRENIFLLRIFSIYICFNIQGTPTGILRVYERFDLLRNQRILTGILNFILLFLGFYLKGTLGYFLLAYMGTYIFQSFLLNYFAYCQLKKHGLEKFYNISMGFNGEFFKFNCLTNINSSLDIPVQYLDNLLIGKFLSLEQLGIYKICKTVTLVLDKIGTPIYQIVYPFFCEQLEKGKRNIVYKRLGIITGILFSIIILGIGFLNIFGFEILSWIFKVDIYKFKGEINFYVLAKGLAVTFIGIHPLFLALGHIKKETVIILIANGIYLLVLWMTLEKYKLYGIIGAYMIQVLLIIILKSLIIFSSSKNKENKLK